MASADDRQGSAPRIWAAPDVAHPDPFSARQASPASVAELVPLSETAVLVVDMVNDFLDPAGLMPLPDTDGVIAATASLVKGAQQAGVHGLRFGCAFEDGRNRFVGDGRTSERRRIGDGGRRSGAPGLKAQAESRGLPAHRFDLFVHSGALRIIGGIRGGLPPEGDAQQEGAQSRIHE